MKKVLSMVLLAAMLMAAMAVMTVPVAAANLSAPWSADGSEMVSQLSQENKSGIIGEAGKPDDSSPYGDSLKITVPQGTANKNAGFINIDNKVFEQDAVFGISLYVNEYSRISVSSVTGVWGEPRHFLDLLNVTEGSLKVLGAEYDSSAAGKWLDFRFVFDFASQKVMAYVNGDLARTVSFPKGNPDWTKSSYININNATSAAGEGVTYLDNFYMALRSNPAFAVSTSIDEGSAETVSAIDVNFTQDVICGDDFAASVKDAATGAAIEGTVCEPVYSNGYVKGLNISGLNISGTDTYKLKISGMTDLYGTPRALSEPFTVADGRIYVNLNMVSPSFNAYEPGAKVKFGVDSHISDGMTVKAYNNGDEGEIVNGKVEFILAEGENVITAKAVDANGTEICSAASFTLNAKGYTIIKNHITATGDTPIWATDGSAKMEVIEGDTTDHGKCYMPDTYSSKTSKMQAGVVNVSSSAPRIIEVRSSHYFLDFSSERTVYTFKIGEDNDHTRWPAYAKVDTNGYLIDGKTTAKYAQLNTNQWYDFRTIVNFDTAEATVFLDGEQLYTVDLTKYVEILDNTYIMYPAFLLGMNSAPIMYIDDVVFNTIRYNTPEIALKISTDLETVTREGVEIKASIDPWMVPEGGSAVLKVNGEVIAPQTSGNYVWNAAGGRNEVYAAILDSDGNEVAVSKTYTFNTQPKSYGAVKEYIADDDYDVRSKNVDSGIPKKKDGSPQLPGANVTIAPSGDAAHGNITILTNPTGGTGGTTSFISSSNRPANNYTDKAYGIEVDVKFCDFNATRDIVGMKFNEKSWIKQPIHTEGNKLYINDMVKGLTYYCDIDTTEWYSFKILMYTDTAMADVYMKKESDAEYTLIGANVKFTTGTIDYIQYFNITGGTTTAESTTYLDNVKFYTLVENDLSVLQDIAVTGANGKAGAMADVSGAFSVNAKIFNYDGAEKTVTAVAAVTEKTTGALYAVKADTVEFASYQKDGEAQFAFDAAPENPENYEVKVFALDGLGNISPLDDTIGIFE